VINQDITETTIETTWNELSEGSGVFDGEQELSNWEAIQEIAHALGAFAVFPNMNGKLSPEANLHNSEVTKSQAGEYKVAIVMRFPPKLDDIRDVTFEEGNT